MDPDFEINFEILDQMEDLACEGDFEQTAELFHPSIFPHHSTRLFSDMKEDPAVHSDFVNMILANGVLGYVTEEDIMVSSDELCGEYGMHVMILSARLGRMRESCFVRMAEWTLPEHIRYIPVSFVQKFPVTFVAAFDAVGQYSPEQLAVVTSVPQACDTMNSLRLKMMRKPEQFQMFRPMCLLNLPELHRADFSYALSQGMVPPEFFAYYDGDLHDACWPHMTAKHIRYLAAESPTMTANVPLERITPAAARGVTPNQFMYFYQHRRAGGIELVKGQWAKFPRSIFNNLRTARDYVGLAIKLTPSNYKFMTTWQINAILQHPEACAHIADGSFRDMSRRVMSRLNFSSKCFANIKPRLQYKILTSDIKLSDDVLEHISSKHLLKMDYSIYTLNKIKAKNRKQIIRNLSSKVESGTHHACRLVKNADVLHKMRIFREQMPKKCWQFMGFKIKVKHIVKDPKLFAGRPKVLKTIVQNDKYVLNFRRFTRRNMEALTAGKAGYECKHIPRRIYDNMTGEQRVGLSPQCVASLPFLKDLQQDEIMNLRPNAFAKFSSRMAVNVNFGTLFNHHLEHLSEDVPVDETVGSLLTKDILENQIGAERLSHLPARIWATVPTSAFTIFRDRNILSRVAGSKMAYWTPEQVKMIPKETFIHLNPDQATCIGDLTTEKPRLAQYLQGFSTKFDPMVRDAFNLRFGPVLQKDSAAPRLFSLSSALITAALAALIL